MPDNNKETHLTYQQKKSIDYTLRLREVLSELPPFCKDISEPSSQRHLQKHEFHMPMI